MATLPINHKTANASPKHDSGKENWGHGRGGRPWRRKRAAVFKRDKYLCQMHLKMGQIVHVNMNEPNAGICDHIQPKASGGSDHESNLQTLCKACSEAKTQIESGNRKSPTFA